MLKDESGKCYQIWLVVELPLQSLKLVSCEGTLSQLIAQNDFPYDQLRKAANSLRGKIVVLVENDFAREIHTQMNSLVSKLHYLIRDLTFSDYQFHESLILITQDCLFASAKELTTSPEDIIRGRSLEIHEVSLLRFQGS